MAFILAAVTLYSAVLVSAQAPNATAPISPVDERVGWVPSSPRRSTMDIIWSCVSILLVCSYKCLHFNISSFEEKQARWHETKRFRIPYWPEGPLIRKQLRKLKWMAIILVAPEIGVGVAVKE